MSKQEVVTLVGMDDSSGWEKHQDEEQGLVYWRRIYIHAAPDIIAAGFVVQEQDRKGVVYKVAVSVCVNDPAFTTLFDRKESFVDVEEAQKWCDQQWFAPDNLPTRLKFAELDAINDNNTMMFALLDVVQQVALHTIPREYLPESMTGQPPMEVPVNMQDDQESE